MLIKHEDTFDTIVSPRNPFSIKEDICDLITEKKTMRRILCRRESKREIVSLRDSYTLARGNEYIGKYKLFVSKADGAAGQIGNPIPARIIGKAEFGEKDMICSETFLAIGPFESIEKTKNISKYMQTKLEEIMVMIDFEYNGELLRTGFYVRRDVLIEFMYTLF